MKSRCRGLLLAGLCALSACDAVSTAPGTGQAPQRTAATDAPPGTPPAVIDALKRQEGLTVDAGDFVLRMTGPHCREFARDVAICDRGNRLEVATADGSFQQTMQPESIFVDGNALAYCGPLDEANKPDTHTFVVSDVNGDGRNDLMIWSGREGAYGGPSFDVYLFDQKKPEFLHSQPFSDLTVGYLGLFGIEDGKIKTTTKSGCCMHMYETYVVEDNEPRIIERVTEDATKGDGDVQIKTERLVGGELKEVQAKN